MDGWLSTKGISDILGVKENSIIQSIRRGKFTQIRQQKVTGKGARGGQIWQVHIDDPAIPEAAREEYKAARAREAAQSGGGEEEEAAILKRLGVNPESETVKSALKAGRERRKQEEQDACARQRMKELSLARFNQLPEKKQESGNARREILKLAAAFCTAAGKHPGNEKWLRRFADEYNTGRLTVPPSVRGKIQTVSGRTIYRWREKYEEGGMYALADCYVSNVGKTLLSKEQQDLAIAMQIQFPGCSTKKVVSALEARGMAADPHAVRRFVKRWLEMNASLHLFMTNPDEWKNKHMFAFGSASEAVVRLNQLWEADSTPGDILLEDGRHTVIGMIDVYTRRPRLLVSPTSKATAVAALIRRCIIEWGVTECLKTDNGQDYVAAHIERILEALEVDHALCPPFTPECKPHIERFFHTFSHGIVELLPGYCGHSVADRKAIEARKSFADRLMKRGGEVEAKLTSMEFQKICDRWVDAIYMHDPHAGLDGKTPAEMVRNWTSPIRVVTDERALDVLLHPAARDGGFRFIGKEGVSVDNRPYRSPEFAGHEGERVRVLVDETDIGHAYIFSKEGDFICVAENREWQGLSAADLASHAKARQKALLLEQRKEMKELVKKAKAETIPEDILRYREDRIATIAEFPKQTVSHVTPALEEAAKAALERSAKGSGAAPQHIELSPEVLEFEARCEEEARQKVVSLEQARRFRDITTPTEVYFTILERIKSGTATPYQLQWKKDYEYWGETAKKVGLLKADPYCFDDPEEKKEREKEAGNN